jgi:hypothetical protein
MLRYKSKNPRHKKRAEATPLAKRASRQEGAVGLENNHGATFNPLEDTL